MESWKKLKAKSGVVGPSATTGGVDLDKAERAIFAVYIAFFEMSDTISKIVEDTSVDISPTLKYIVK